MKSLRIIIPCALMIACGLIDLSLSHPTPTMEDEVANIVAKNVKGDVSDAKAVNVNVNSGHNKHPEPQILEGIDNNKKLKGAETSGDIKLLAADEEKITSNIEEAKKANDEPKPSQEVKKALEENHPLAVPMFLAELEKQYPGRFQLGHNVERPELKFVNGKPVQRSSLGAILPQPDQPDLPAILAGDYKRIVSKIQEELKNMGISENHPFNLPLFLAKAEKQYPGLFQLVHNIERPELKSVNGKPVQRSSLGAILPQPDQPDLPAILAGDYKKIVSKIQEELKNMGISENHPFNFPLFLAQAEKRYPGLFKLVHNIEKPELSGDEEKVTSHIGEAQDANSKKQEPSIIELANKIWHEVMTLDNPKNQEEQDQYERFLDKSGFGFGLFMAKAQEKYPGRFRMVDQVKRLQDPNVAQDSFRSSQIKQTEQQHFPSDVEGEVIDASSVTADNNSGQNQAPSSQILEGVGKNPESNNLSSSSNQSDRKLLDDSVKPKDNAPKWLMHNTPSRNTGFSLRAHAQIPPVKSFNLRKFAQQNTKGSLVSSHVVPSKPSQSSVVFGNRPSVASIAL